MADKFFMITDNLIEINGLKNRQTGEYENGATIKMSLFKQDTLNIDISRLSFTSGGVAEPEVGQTIVGATDGAWAKIASIVLTDGTWAGGDAEGYFTLTGQHGTFVAENLDIVDGQADIATIAADSTGAETSDGGSKTKITVTDHGLKNYETCIRIEGSQAYDGECTISTFEKNKLIIDVAYTAEKFRGDEVIYVGIPNGTGLPLSWVDPSDGNYKGILPDTLKGVLRNNAFYIFITITKGSNVKTYALEWESDYPGKDD